MLSSGGKLDRADGRTPRDRSFAKTAIKPKPSPLSALCLAAPPFPFRLEYANDSGEGSDYRRHGNKARMLARPYRNG